MKSLGFLRLLQVKCETITVAYSLSNFRQAYIKCPVGALILAWMIDHPVPAFFLLLASKCYSVYISCNTRHSGFALFACSHARVIIFYILYSKICIYKITITPTLFNVTILTFQLVFKSCF